MPADLIARLKTSPVLCDGATGTLLYAKGSIHQSQLR